MITKELASSSDPSPIEIATSNEFLKISPPNSANLTTELKLSAIRNDSSDSLKLNSNVERKCSIMDVDDVNLSGIFNQYNFGDLLHNTYDHE